MYDPNECSINLDMQVTGSSMCRAFDREKKRKNMPLPMNFETVLFKITQKNKYMMI